MAANPMVTLVILIDTRVDTCYWCAGLVPEHCEIPYNACPDHYDEAKQSILDAGVEPTETEE